MSITATELKTNLGKYLMLAETEDIYITRNGKVVAKLSNPYQDRVDVAKSLFGVLPNDMTCLLYTSDAADDLLCVDLGGRRIIQKKNRKKKKNRTRINIVRKQQRDNNTQP